MYAIEFETKSHFFRVFRVFRGKIKEKPFFRGKIKESRFFRVFRVFRGKNKTVFFRVFRGKNKESCFFSCVSW